MLGAVESTASTSGSVKPIALIAALAAILLFRRRTPVAKMPARIPTEYNQKMRQTPSQPGGDGCSAPMILASKGPTISMKRNALKHPRIIAQDRGTPTALSVGDVNGVRGIRSVNRVVSEPVSVIRLFSPSLKGRCPHLAQPLDSQTFAQGA